MSSDESKRSFAFLTLMLDSATAIASTAGKHLFDTELSFITSISATDPTIVAPPGGGLANSINIAVPDVRPSAVAEESDPVGKAVVVDDGNVANDHDNDDEDDDEVALDARLPPRLKTTFEKLLAERARLSDLRELYLDTIEMLQEQERKITGVEWGSSDYQGSDEPRSRS